MNILLIIPPAPFLLSETSVTNLGLLYIASYAKSHGYSPTILDLLGKSDYADIIAKCIKDKSWDCVGITLTTSQAKYAIEIAKIIKSISPNLRVIAGGPHITYTYLSFKKQKTRNQKMIDDLEQVFDVCVVGDGEKGLIDATTSKNKWIDATVPPLYMSSSDLELAPSPGYHFINLQSYDYQLSSNERTSTNFSDKVISLISQRGCPYKCRFCAGSNDTFFKKIRKVSSEKTIREIEHLYKTYGYKRFSFYDDELNVSNELDGLLKALQNLQMKLGVKMDFRGFLKANLITTQQVKRLKEAGFAIASIGLESGSERILKNINKRASVEQNEKAIEILRENGIQDKCSISIGHPGESHQTIAETYQWLEKMKLNDVSFMIVSLMPSSIYYDLSVPDGNGDWVYISPETGDKLFSQSIDYHNHPNFFYEGTSYVWTEHLNATEISIYWNQLRKRFRNYE